jgi:ADP-dependent NAD(P)H-hydrate dehydratase / NAD(P)H-hydrate epimerase
VIPVVTPERMRVIDAASAIPVEQLIERAGRAVARSAIDMMGGTYGRRVVVLAGRGNNGADGRAAAMALQRRGVRVDVRDIDDNRSIGAVDLVIDAALGTGVSRPWKPPVVDSSIDILAVDIPSGVDGLTGHIHGDALSATRTVTFAALKPGLLFGDGAALVGQLELADIGLEVSDCDVTLLDAGDIAALLPPRLHDAHKWQSALWIIGGSLGMTGAPRLVARAAQRAGAGIVRCSVPGDDYVDLPIEAVGVSLPETQWAAKVLAGLDHRHISAVAIGPGLGRSDATALEVRKVLLDVAMPCVVDADALFALAWGTDGPESVLLQRSGPTVLTPHDGEFRYLSGDRPNQDRISATRDVAFSTNSVVLLKGSTTVIAAPDGRVRLMANGDARLATAGTGDVLTGIIGALLARGASGFDAASAGAWLHAQASNRASQHAMVASDVCDHLPAVLDQVMNGPFN